MVDNEYDIYSFQLKREAKTKETQAEEDEIDGIRLLQFTHFYYLGC